MTRWTSPSGDACPDPAVPMAASLTIDPVARGQRTADLVAELVAAYSRTLEVSVLTILA